MWVKMMNTLRSLVLLGIFAVSVFLVGLSIGVQFSRNHTTFPSASPSSPDLLGTIAALEERLKTVEATSRPPTTPSPTTTGQGQQPSHTFPLPSPTLRTVTRATLTVQTETEMAAAIAREYLGGGEVIAVERERKYGADVFEVKFKYGSEVYVDVRNARVIYAEVNPADKTGSPTSTPTPLPTRSPTPPPPPPTATPAPVATSTPELSAEEPVGSEGEADGHQEPEEEQDEQGEQPETPPPPQSADADDSSDDQEENRSQSGEDQEHDDEENDEDED